MAGINVSKTLKSLRTLTVADCKKKIQLSYSKIVANRGRYNRKSLAKLYSVLQIIRFCFFLVFTLFFIKKISVQFVLIISVFYCICLHGIGNRSLISIYSFPDIGSKLIELAGKIPQSTYKYLPAHGALLVCFSFLFFLFCVVFVSFFYWYSALIFCSGSKINYYYYNYCVSNCY